jgi:hypothetical protein
MLVFVGVRVGVLVLADGTGVDVGVLVLPAGTAVRVGVLVLLVAGTRVGVLDGTGVGVLVAPLEPGEDPVTLTEPAESFQVCWVDQSDENTPTWIEYEPRRAFAGTFHATLWSIVWPAP